MDISRICRRSRMRSNRRLSQANPMEMMSPAAQNTRPNSIHRRCLRSLHAVCISMSHSLMTQCKKSTQSSHSPHTSSHGCSRATSTRGICSGSFLIFFWFVSSLFRISIFFVSQVHHLCIFLFFFTFCSSLVLTFDTCRSLFVLLRVKEVLVVQAKKDSWKLVVTKKKKKEATT